MNHLCLLDLVLLNVSRDEITNKSWEKLGNLSQSKSLVNKLFFWKKLFHVRMEEGDLMIEHLNAFNIMKI